MPQLHLYVPDDIAAELKRRAEEAGLSTSRFLAEVVARYVTTDWPAGFFEEVVGGWQGEPLERGPQGSFEEREALDPPPEEAPDGPA